MDRVFLDANVLFSMAYRPGAGLLRLCNLPDVKLMSSVYAYEEAERNLQTQEQRERLRQIALFDYPFFIYVFERASLAAQTLPVDLPEKDRPILQAAMALKASHLLTGDIKHFGPYLDTTVGGVLIQRPAVYLASKQSSSGGPPSEGRTQGGPE